ncbi:MAG TPA: tetratricopeptide repeat protein [Kofleriaceae bacterium]|nr:tetratricopeptide repeat protein [Kofleriaceae bacterium]
MRLSRALVWIVVAACGGSPARSTLPGKPSPAVPADDLAQAKASAKPVQGGESGLAAKDPRIVDLDIIRIRATPSNGAGDREMTTVATADLFRSANEAAKAGNTKDAIARYRQLIAEFPESQYAPVSLFNIAAIYDGQGDITSTITTLRELVTTYPNSRESIEGHLYIAALQADKQQWPDALATLDAALARANLTFADRVEANARRGYVLLELKRYDDAEAALVAAIGEWRRAPRIDDPYYIAMAGYYRGEVAHRKFTESPVRMPDDQLIADLETKRVLAAQAYDRWKESLGYNHAYWGTAAGYQMSQIFVELWEVTVKAPYPQKLSADKRTKYVAELHDRVREHLEKALEGHRMNIELAKAYGVDTTWSKGSQQRAVQVMELLAKDAKGSFVVPEK